MNWSTLFFCFGLAVIIAAVIVLIVVADNNNNKWYDKGYNDVVKSVLNGTINIERLSYYCLKHDAAFYQLDKYHQHINEEYARGYNDGLKYLQELYGKH